jgi:redox-sensitive bicupin YhaK (pirin superfamily)
MILPIPRHYIADLVTFTAFPSYQVEHLNPFLLLNHHGPQVYPKNNNGLPFGPHPHKGMQTVTFVFEGDIRHADSAGFGQTIHAGGMQWMRAGKGLLHMETSSEDFKESGGPLDIIQLWLNLPKAMKESEPLYVGAEANEISFTENDGVRFYCLSSIAGEGLIQPGFPCTLGWYEISVGKHLTIEIPTGFQVLWYQSKGSGLLNSDTIEAHQLYLPDDGVTKISFAAHTDCRIVFGMAKPIEEPIVMQGPFVMNTEEEIHQAYEDFRKGKMGVWK